VPRPVRILFFVALALTGAVLALLTVEALLLADLMDDGLELREEYWGAIAFAGVAATLCALDLTALIVALRGRRLLAQYRQERDDWREARQAQGSLLRRRDL
jgi:predicted Co/Zn/Cd cation transporter (cation efflux family)